MIPDRNAPAAAQRRSRQRDRILEILNETTTHPTAEWVHERLRRDMPRVSLGTVYRNADTQRYRLGVNHTQLPVNRPHAAEAANYGRDGAMRFDGNGGSSVNYEPNSRGGPAQTGEPAYQPLEIHGIAGAQAQGKHRDDSDFVQAGALYRVMKEDERERLVANLAGSLAQVRDQAVVDRCVSYFRAADREYGDRLQKAIAALKAKK